MKKKKVMRDRDEATLSSRKKKLIYKIRHQRQLYLNTVSRSGEYKKI